MVIEETFEQSSKQEAQKYGRLRGNVSINFFYFESQPSSFFAVTKPPPTIIQAIIY